MMKQYLVVDLQGFKDYKNDFIVKEFALANNEYTKMFLVKPPFAYSELTPVEKKHVNWIEKNRGIFWREGFIDMHEFKKVIKPYLQNCEIFVKGSEKIQWVKDICKECNVTNVEEMGCPNLKTLDEINYNNIKSIVSVSGDVWWDHPISKFNDLKCINHRKICALKHVILLRNWIEKNQ